MKKGLLITLISLANFVNAQSFQAYYDASDIGAGFSYNIQISVTPIGGTNNTLHAGGYKVKLVSVNADSKGYYSKGKTNTYYSCSQLGGICNPNKFTDVYIGLNYQCKNSGLQQVRFTRVGEEQTISLRLDPNTTCSFELGKVQVKNTSDEVSYRNRIREIEYPQTNSSGLSGSTTSNNPATQTNTNQSENSKNKNTETKTTTEQIPESYKGNPMTYNNESSSNSNNTTTQIVNSATNILNQWANQVKSDNEAEEQRQNRIEEERVRKQNIADKLRANKLRLVRNRKSLIASAPDGETPLSYELEEGVTEIFYFVYSYQAATIENESPPIYISNVFSLVKYADGTWPFKTSLIENITKTNIGLDFVLCGYYLDKIKAEQQQQYFMNKANNFRFAVNKISYESKKPSQTTSGGLDYWGNPIKKEGQQSNPKMPDTIKVEKNKPKVDYWGNPIKE